MTDIEEFSTATTLPTLRERSLEALQDAIITREDAEAAIIHELRIQAYDFLVYKLDVPAGSASVALSDATPCRTTNEKHEGHPSSAAKGQALLVKVDGDTLRFSFERVKLFTLGASDNKEFQSETVWDDNLVVEWRSPGMSFYKITDLATLGARVAEHVR